LTNPIRRVGVVTREFSPEAERTALELTDWLHRRQIEVALDSFSQPENRPADLEVYDPEERYDLVVVLGGDGTLLSVARSVATGVPILGVNLGRLGFLTELSRAELYPNLVRILEGDHWIDERSLLDVELRRTDGSKEKFLAFNDAVIAKNALAHIIELKIKIGRRLVARYRSDGLIISTPSGSTAYNMSAGGPILSPELPVTVLTPICPHTLSLRPIVVPDRRTIEVTLETENEEVFVTVDGQEGGALGYRDAVRVKRSKSTARLVRTARRSFYENLRGKLGWGG